MNIYKGKKGRRKLAGKETNAKRQRRKGCASIITPAYSIKKSIYFVDFKKRSLLLFSGQGMDREDTVYWYSESTSTASSVASSEYNSDDGFIDIEDKDLNISSFSVSI